MTQNADLSVRAVTRTFGSGETLVEAVKEASFSLDRGQFVAIVGPSGSGKTTLLAMIGALLTPTSGTIAVGGLEITALGESDRARFRRENIGFIFQGFNLVPYLSAEQNLLAVAAISTGIDRETRDRCSRLLEELGISDHRHRLPGELSGGEKQRVAVGRALMNDPLLVLADEPSSNLDSEKGKRVVQLLAEEVKTRNKIGIMVTHDQRMLDYVDSVLEIADGRLTVPTEVA